MNKRDIDINTNKVEMPSIVFKLKNTFYSIDSANVVTILEMPEYELANDAPECILGNFNYRGYIIPIIDLRTVFGYKTLNSEYKAFMDMIDLRINEHKSWADELERSILNQETFKLTTDPHKCNFGKWYDNFSSEINTVNFQLKKIDEPHKKLHQAAHDVENCRKECDKCKRDECLKTTLKRVKNQYVPTIVGLLEETKLIFKDAFREVLLIVKHEDGCCAIAVDEVVSVEILQDMTDDSNINISNTQLNFKGIKNSKNVNNIILDIDYNKIILSSLNI